ncbi:hypothetical protein ACQP2H_10535 [Micromonospora sp. CA-248260]|uniref:hypothetical protein n=1 Tax=Micromonospora sp. CA-248260 TaxID=3239962 RepID=UPI003D9010FF
MAKFVMHNTRIFAGAADLTGVSNKVEVSSEVEEKEVTAFNPVEGQPAWKEVLGGLASTKISGEGQWEAGDPSKVDNESWSGLGAVGAWTICPTAASSGNLAYFTNGLRTSYEVGGKVGDVAPWKAEASGTWPLVRGVSLHSPGTPRTATGSAPGVLHVAVPAGKQLYAALHVLSVAGTGSPSLTVVVESDDAVGFPSPATRLSFAAATAVGSQILRSANTNTDTYYRVSYTISGTTPSFLFMVSVGVA